MIDRYRIEVAKRIIEPRLSPDEKLIWVGRPDPEKFFAEVARACLLQLALAALLVPVFLFVIFRFSVVEGTLMPIVLFAGGVIGFFLISAPWRYPERVSATVYAITDRRTLVHEGVGWSLLWLDALPNLTIRSARLTRVKYARAAELSVTEAESIWCSAARGTIISPERGRSEIGFRLDSWDSRTSMKSTPC
jgi:hypothetical protein